MTFVLYFCHALLCTRVIALLCCVQLLSCMPPPLLNTKLRLLHIGTQCIYCTAEGIVDNLSMSQLITFHGNGEVFVVVPSRMMMMKVIYDNPWRSVIKRDTR